VIPAQGRYLAEHIAGAQYLELTDGGHWPWTAPDADRFLDKLEEFLTGAPQVPGRDRALATVAFTGIVDSTAMAATMGDRRWRELLEVHDSVAHREVEAARGRTVKSTGDGVLATFDGPARAIRCVGAIARGVATLGLHVRAGLHTGEIELLVQGDIDKTVGGRIGINAHLLQARDDVGIVVTLDLGVQDGTWVDDCDSHGRILRSHRGCPASASTVSVLEQDGRRVRERPSELGEWRLRQRPCPKQEGTFSMASVHTLDQLDSCFDDSHGVASAGLLLPATLAERLGIEAAVNELVDLGDRPGAHRPGRKVLTLLHALVIGGDCIDDADVLRTGFTAAVLGHRVMALPRWGPSCAASPSATSASSTAWPRPSWAGRRQPAPDPAMGP
jgi:class 3 adenylate cyclase